MDLEVIAHAQRKVIDAFMSPVEACASGDAKYADLVRLTHLHYLVAVAEGEGCGASTPVLVAKVLPPFPQAGQDCDRVLLRGPHFPQLW